MTRSPSARPSLRASAAKFGEIGRSEERAPFDLAKGQGDAGDHKRCGQLRASSPTTPVPAETEASPKIWDEKTKFDGIFAKLKSDAETA